MDRFSNQLSDAQVERLAILAEELGEAQQVIGKILRHGYESVNPLDCDSETNRDNLERECGDIMLALDLLCEASDLSGAAVIRRQKKKRETIKRWLHHQGEQADGQ